MLRRLALLVVLTVMGLPACAGANAVEVLRIQGDAVKWPPPAAGRVTTLTYTMLASAHILPNGAQTLSASNCGAMRPFADITENSAALSPSAAAVELRAAFDAWEAVADIRFVEVAPGQEAHIVVGAIGAVAGRAFANLRLQGKTGVHPVGKALSDATTHIPTALAAAGDQGAVAVIEQAYICLDAHSRWKIGFDGNLSVYDLRYTFMHEIGHAIGLDHPGRSGAVMGYRYDERARALQASDVEAARWLYGPSQPSPQAEPTLVTRGCDADGTPAPQRCLD